MIFLTLGTQLPFDRLVRAVDDWAGARGRGAEVFGQIPRGDGGGYAPRHFDWVEMLPPVEHRRRSAAADLIVSHAGMGAIITALDVRTPIVVMPRRADLGEQRNDHQLATARRFGTRPGIHAVETAGALAAALDDPGGVVGTAEDGLPPFAEDRLIAAIRAEIDRA